MAEGATTFKHRSRVAPALPGNPEIEAAILGSVLLTGDIPKGLNARLLQNPRHQELLLLFERMRSDGRPLDLPTMVGAVAEAQAIFGRDGVGWVAALPAKVPSIEAVPGWLRELRRLAHHRDMVVWSMSVQDAISRHDFEEVARLQKSTPKEELLDDKAEPSGQLPAEAPDPDVRRDLRLALKRRASDRLQADIALRQDPRWEDRIWYDSFRQIQMIGARRHTDQDDQATALWLEKTYRIRMSAGSLAPILSAIAADNQRDPLLDYLFSLRWDGVERLSNWLVTGLGVADSPLVRLIGRRWLIQAVARALRPGCKADVVLMLVGPQGAQKSSSLRALVGPEFFSDSPILMGDKDGIEQTHAAWVHELAELVGMKKREVEEIKAHISAQEDTWRPSYARKPITAKRRCVFAATTNEDTPLIDQTGGRRFWPVLVQQANRAWIAQHRDQLWAEAVAAFHAGEQWHLSQEEEADVTSARQDFQREEPWEERIVRLLDDADNINSYWTSGRRHNRKWLTTAVILDFCLKIPATQQTPGHTQTVGRLLKSLGFKRRKGRVGDRTFYGYIPTGQEEEEEA